ncbi:MAG: nitroreductase family protein [Desulfohalobiaceae bacterium]
MHQGQDNPTICSIYNRRSIRQFLDKPVPQELIQTVLDCANQAPSAHNQQPWKFIVIQDQKKTELQSLISKKAQSFHKPVSTILRMASRTIASAPVVIAVMNTGQIMANGSRLFRVAPEQGLDFFRTMEIQSSAAAVQNLLLAATSMGLGSVWLGILYVVKEELLSFLQEPDGEFMAVIPIGYPQKTSQGPRKKSLQNVVKYL